MLSIGVTYADVTLFGTIDQAYAKTEWTDTTGIKYSKTGFSGVQNGGSGIGFKGEEDLGNGLKASFLHELGVSTEGAAATSVRQGFVALGGGFGQVRIGKQYSQAFLNTLSVDSMGATGVYGYNSYIVLLGQGGDAPLRQSNSLQYTLPTFVDGVGITLTKTYGAGDQTNAGDGMGAAVTYANGPLHLGYTFDNTANKGITLTTPDGVETDVVAASTANNNELKTLSASYDLGLAKLGFNNAKVSVGAQSLDSTTLTVGIPAGAAMITLSSSSGTLKLAAADVKHSGFQVGLDYNLSKRTVAYAQIGNTKFDNTAKDKFSMSAFGLRHSF